MNVPQKTPSYFTLDLTSNSQQVDISLTIPRQVLYLVGYRCEMSSQANALAAQVIYFELEGLLSSNQLIDNNTFVQFPLCLENNIVTLRDGLELPVYLNKSVPERFTVRVFDKSLVPLVNLVRLTLHFKAEYGHLS